MQVNTSPSQEQGSENPSEVDLVGQQDPGQSGPKEPGQSELQEPEDIFATQMAQVSDRLSPQSQPEPQTGPAPASNEAPASEPEEITAPIHWPKERQEMFNNLPAQAKLDYMAVSKEQERAFNEKNMLLAEYRREVADAVAKLAEGNLPAQPKEEDNSNEPPEDPIERIKWEAKQEVLQELNRKDAEVREAQRLNEIKLVRERVNTDPLKGYVQQVLNARVAQAPDIIDRNDPQGRTYRQIEFDRLNSEPEYYKSQYMLSRSIVEASLGKSNVPGQNAPQQQQPPQQQRRTAPQLEGAGRKSPPKAPAADNGKARAEIVEKIRKGAVDPSTLGSFLQNSIKRAF